MPFAVETLDHVVLTCRNINATVKFYNLLGMKHEVFRSSKDAPGVERYVQPLLLLTDASYLEHLVAGQEPHNVAVVGLNLQLE